MRKEDASEQLVPFCGCAVRPTSWTERLKWRISGTYPFRQVAFEGWSSDLITKEEMARQFVRHVGKETAYGAAYPEYKKQLERLDPQVRLTYLRLLKLALENIERGSLTMISDERAWRPMCTDDPVALGGEFHFNLRALAPDDVLRVAEGRFMGIIFNTHHLLFANPQRKGAYQVDTKNISEGLNAMVDTYRTLLSSKKSPVSEVHLLKPGEVEKTINWVRFKDGKG